MGQCASQSAKYKVIAPRDVVVDDSRTAVAGACAVTDPQRDSNVKEEANTSDKSRRTHSSASDAPPRDEPGRNSSVHGRNSSIPDVTRTSNPDCAQTSIPDCAPAPTQDAADVRRPSLPSIPGRLSVPDSVAGRLSASGPGLPSIPDSVAGRHSDGRLSAPESVPASVSLPASAPGLPPVSGHASTLSDDDMPGLVSPEVRRLSRNPAAPPNRSSRYSMDGLPIRPFFDDFDQPSDTSNIIHRDSEKISASEPLRPCNDLISLREEREHCLGITPPATVRKNSKSTAQASHTSVAPTPAPPPLSGDPSSPCADHDKWRRPRPSQGEITPPKQTLARKVDVNSINANSLPSELLDSDDESPVKAARIPGGMPDLTASPAQTVAPAQTPERETQIAPLATPGRAGSKPKPPRSYRSQGSSRNVSRPTTASDVSCATPSDAPQNLWLVPPHARKSTESRESAQTPTAQTPCVPAIPNGKGEFTDFARACSAVM